MLTWVETTTIAEDLEEMELVEVVALVPALTAMKRVTLPATAPTRTRDLLEERIAAESATSATRKVTLRVTALTTKVVTPTRRDHAEKTMMVGTQGPITVAVVTTTPGELLELATPIGTLACAKPAAGISERGKVRQALA